LTYPFLYLCLNDKQIIMITVKNLLDTKGYDVWSIKPEATVFEAPQLLTEKGIGALPIVKDGIMVGIFSERDYVRKLVKSKDFSDKSKVSDFMTHHVVTVRSYTDVMICMILMNDMRIRHLPVIDDDKLVGMVSIGDVINSIVKMQTQTIKDLEGYIAGNYGVK
jgi:CBS domain-containing protein